MIFGSATTSLTRDERILTPVCNLYHNLIDLYVVSCEIRRGFGVLGFWGFGVFGKAGMGRGYAGMAR